MAHAFSVYLDGDGAFTGEGPLGTFLLLFDPSGDGGRWLLTGPLRDDTGVPSLVCMPPSLDEGLDELSRACDHDGPFDVHLPDGGHFSRPGKVPGVEVLSALGYDVVDRVTAYVMGVFPAGRDPARVRRDFARALSGRSVTVGRPAEVEQDGDGVVWCVEVGVPFEGAISRKDASYVAREALQDAGLDLVDAVEVSSVRKVVPNSATLFRLQTRAKAA